MSDYGLEAEYNALRLGRERQQVEVAGSQREALEVARGNIAAFLRHMDLYSVPSSSLKVCHIEQVKRKLFQGGPKWRTKVSYTDTQYHGWCIAEETYDSGLYALRVAEKAIVLTTEGLVFECNLRLDQKTKKRTVLMVEDKQLPTALEDWEHATLVFADTLRLAHLMDRYIRGVELPWEGTYVS